MNSVHLIGRLTKDPTESYTPNEQMCISKFSIAVDRNTTPKTADFIRITVFGKQAEACNRYLQKGKQVAVDGRIQTGSYKDREGKTVYTTDVIANKVEFLGSSQEKKQEPEQYGFEAVYEDMPF